MTQPAASTPPPSGQARRQFLHLLAGGLVGSTWSRSGSSTERGTRHSQSAEPSQGEAFDPEIHGFAFPNWKGSTGIDADGEEFTYEPEDVTLEAVQEAMEQSWTSTLETAHQKFMERIVYSWIGGGVATNGHCYGMVFAADGYFQHPSDLPSTVDVASEIPRPTDEYDEVGNRIRRLQSSQLLRAEPYWFGLLGLRWGLADHRESLHQLTDAIDETGTAGIALDGEKNPHQVLAHGYEHDGDVTHVFIYDPRDESHQHTDPEDVWLLSVDPETGDVLEIADGYETFLYHDPEMDRSMVDRQIGGLDRVRDRLSNALFLGLETAGELEIDLPEDVQIDRPAAEFAAPEMRSYADAVIVLDPPDSFEIGIAVDGADSYSVETLGLRDGEIVLEDTVSGQLNEVGVRLEFAVDEAAEYGVEVVDAVESETGESRDRIDWIEENWWLPAVGGALGLGTAYVLLTQRSEDEKR